jgi:hypothetical protein
MRIYNEILNPDIWKNNEEIKSDIRVRLLQIASDFYKDTKLEIPYNDVLLLGSNANYNWTPTSDIDIHLVLDFKKLKMPLESAKEFTNLLKYKWNFEHDIHIKTYNIETYIQDINHKTHATGIYSILNNKWIVRPEKKNIILDKDLIQQKYNDMAKKIFSAIQEKNLERMKQVLKDVYDFREVGLDSSEGEFSTENVVFKLLRAKHHIDKLRDAVNALYDKQVSTN